MSKTKKIVNMLADDTAAPAAARTLAKAAEPADRHAAWLHPAPDDFAVGTGMNRVAEERGFIVAYPAHSQAAEIDLRINARAIHAAMTEMICDLLQCEAGIQKLARACMTQTMRADPVQLQSSPGSFKVSRDLGWDGPNPQGSARVRGAPGEADALPVLLQRHPPVLGVERRRLDRAVEVREIPPHRLPPIFRRQPVRETVERGPQPAHHLNRARTELPDLIESERQVILPIRSALAPNARCCCPGPEI